MPLVARRKPGNMGALDFVRIVEHEMAADRMTAVLIARKRAGLRGWRITRDAGTRSGVYRTRVR